MSEQTTTRNRQPVGVAGGAQVQPNGEQQPAKTRRPRSPSAAKPAFIMLQVVDEQGNATAFDKKRLKILAVERDAAKVLEAIDGGAHDNAFYLRVMLPAGSRAGIPNKPKSE